MTKIRRFATSIAVIALIPLSVAFAQQPSNASPFISLMVPTYAQPNELFRVDVSLKPSSQKQVFIQMEEGDLKYSESSFDLKPGKRKFLSAKSLPTRDGITWIHAIAQGYPDAWLGVNLGFLGHIKSPALGKLPYHEPTTLTLMLVDKNDKPFYASSSLYLHLESADADLVMGSQKGPLDLKLSAGSTASPQFQIVPRNRNGGIAHLTSTLKLDSDGASLDSQSLSFQTEPASWLPILLALGGGLLYGIYKICKFDYALEGSKSLAIKTIVTSIIAGYLGYLIANFDLLGLKLDLSVLRSYSLSGFIVAYMGFDVFLKNTKKDT